MWKSGIERKACNTQQPRFHVRCSHHIDNAAIKMRFALLCLLPSMALGRSGESFVAAAAASRSMIAEVSCPPDPLRAPRAVLLFTGHLKGTCAIHPGAPAKSTRSPKIDAIVNQIRWCREAFGGGCHAFLHTWSTLDKAPIRLDGVALSRLNLSQGLVPGGFLKHGSRSLEHTPRSSSACVEQIRAAVGARHLTVATETQVPQVSIEQAASPWGIVPELLDLGMRMQLAGIGGGLALAARHVPCYDALVRMRADVGDQKAAAAKAVFLDAQGWRNVHSRAKLVAHGNVTAGAQWAREVVTCSWPRGSMSNVETNVSSLGKQHRAGYPWLEVPSRLRMAALSGLVRARREPLGPTV